MKKSQTAPHQTSDNEQQVLEHIRKRAYELWEAHGCPDGCDRQHWLEAEQQIRAQIKPQPRTG